VTTTVPSRNDLDKILARLDALEAAVAELTASAADGGTP
jgi:hypothetical protein